MDSSSNHQTLHFVLIPWLAQGHMIPMLDIARLLADRGVIVSFITTPANAARIKPTINRISASGLPIRFVTLRFPFEEVGLPEGCENIDSIPSSHLIGNFFKGAKLLREPLERHLRNQTPAPSCIVSGFAHAWAHEMAREFGVPRLIFHGFCCFSLLCVHNLYHYKTHESSGSMSEPFVLPGLAQRIEITKAQLPTQFRSSPQFQDIMREIRDVEVSADGVVINSFDGLEPGYAESLEEVTGKKAWTIGPVSLNNKGREDVVERGNKASIDEERCISWLDLMKPKSVIYVSFGSMGRFTAPQLMELGLGLEASNRPFIWVIKGVLKESPDVDKWLSEQFENSVNSRCLLIRGWAPQVMILSHPAIGGFVTHCGWNSTLEGVSAGVPMITWPLFGEQFLNEKLIVKVLKIGVASGVKIPTDWKSEDKTTGIVLVRKEEVTEAVERLMDEGEEGVERRKRAEELGKKAKSAIEEGGSSYLNIASLIQYVSGDRIKHKPNLN